MLKEVNYCSNTVKSLEFMVEFSWYSLEAPPPLNEYTSSTKKNSIRVIFLTDNETNVHRNLRSNEKSKKNHNSRKLAAHELKWFNNMSLKLIDCIDKPLEWIISKYFSLILFVDKTGEISLQPDYLQIL